MVDLSFLRYQGDKAWGAGHWAAAEAVYSTIIAIDPLDEVASWRLIECALALEDKNTALARLCKLSDSYLDEGNTAKALAIFQQAYKEYPEITDIGIELGHLYIALGYIEEGTEQFREVGRNALDHNLEEAMEAFCRWDFLKRLNQHPN